MDMRTITFLIAGVLLGSGIGIAAGYVVWDDSNGDETYVEETYWYYFDFGGQADETNVNKWVKVEAADVVSGLIKAADATYTDNNIFESGWIESINGVTNDENDSLSWANWFFNQAADYNDYGTWYVTQGMNVTPGNVFYIGFYTYDSSYQVMADPNLLTDWQGEGPFA